MRQMSGYRVVCRMCFVLCLSEASVWLGLIINLAVVVEG